MTRNIEGKVVVITGASSGLGEAAARHLARTGRKLVLGARRRDRLQALARELAAGGTTTAVQTDVTDHDAGAAPRGCGGKSASAAST